MIGNSIDQSIKLVNRFWLVLANRWPINNHTKTIYRLLLIIPATLNRLHTRYLSHPQFLESSGDEIDKTNSDPVFSTQRIYPVACVLKSPTCPSLPFHDIMFTQDVWVEAKILNIRCVIILKQLMLLLLAISLFAKVQLLLPEFFCWGATTFRFLKSIDWPMEQTLNLIKNGFLWMGR